MQETILEIAARVRELRGLSNITTTNMASSLGIEEAVYNDYENGKKDISASILIEIAKILKVDPTVLLTGQEGRLHIFSVTRAGKGTSVERRRQYKYEAIATSFINKKADPFIVTVEPKPQEMPVKRASHPGQEFNYVIKGRVKILIHSNEIILAAGDSIYFDASYEHAMVAMDGEKAVFLAVVI